MFFNLHPQTKIGYKLLTDADLGRGTSHQTHIGLFERHQLDCIPKFEHECPKCIAEGGICGKYFYGNI